MAKLDFPDPSQSPYEENGYVYEWDGSKWNIAATPGSGVNLTLQDVTDNGNTTTNGATFGGGNITLNADGSAKFVTNNIEFNADGSAKFRGDTTIQRNLVTAYYGSYADDNNAAVQISTDPLSTTLSIKNPVALSSTTSVFEVLKGGSQSDNRVVDITAGGSAEFAGDTKIGGNGKAGEPGVLIESDGLISACRDGGAVWGGYSNGSTTATSSIGSDGSALFNGNNIQVRCQYSSTRGLSLYGGNASGQTPAITFDEEIRLFDNGAGKGDRLVINADGNADFVGNVTVGDEPGIGSNIGTKLSNQGFISASRASGGAVFNAYKTGDATKQIELKSDGSATFADRVTTGDSAGRGQFLGTCPGSITANSADAFVARYDGAYVFNVKYDGSATFAGNVTVGEAANNGTADGTVIFPQGTMHVSRAAGNALWNGFATGNPTATSNIFSNGNALFRGTIELPTAGTGIGFGGSGDADLLDDYEEGAWTPQLTGSSGGDYTMGGSNAGKYVKIGRMVHLDAVVEWTGGGPYSGSLMITGIPFTPSSTVRSANVLSSINGSAITPSSSSFTWMSIGTDLGPTALFITQNGSGTQNQNPTVASSGSVFAVSITYQTDS